MVRGFGSAEGGDNQQSSGREGGEDGLNHFLELARIAKKNGSSARVIRMYAKNYNMRLQRKKA
jgi:hypothetical protein